jgi:hypothetical protein
VPRQRFPLPARAGMDSHVCNAGFSVHLLKQSVQTIIKER